MLKRNFTSAIFFCLYLLTTISPGFGQNMRCIDQDMNPCVDHVGNLPKAKDSIRAVDPSCFSKDFEYLINKYREFNCPRTAIDYASNAKGSFYKGNTIPNMTFSVTDMNGFSKRKQEIVESFVKMSIKESPSFRVHNYLIREESSSADGHSVDVAPSHGANDKKVDVKNIKIIANRSDSARCFFPVNPDPMCQLAENVMKPSGVENLLVTENVGQDIVLLKRKIEEGSADYNSNMIRMKFPVSLDQEGSLSRRVLDCTKLKRNDENGLILVRVIPLHIFHLLKSEKEYSLSSDEYKFSKNRHFYNSEILTNEANYKTYVKGNMSSVTITKDEMKELGEDKLFYARYCKDGVEPNDCKCLEDKQVGLKGQSCQCVDRLYYVDSSKRGNCTLIGEATEIEKENTVKHRDACEGSRTPNSVTAKNDLPRGGSGKGSSSDGESKDKEIAVKQN